MSQTPNMSKAERTAMWKTRCALAVDPKDTGGAFPGVQRRSAGEAEQRRPHPFKENTRDLRGMLFVYDGRLWSAEAVTVTDTNGTVGLYAYDTNVYASATLCLEERCKAFGLKFVDALDEQSRGRPDDMKALDAAAVFARTCGAAYGRVWRARRKGSGRRSQMHSFPRAVR